MHLWPRRVIRPVEGKRGQRRGATMVLVAVTATVLFMFGGFGIDFGRMYTFVAQLKTLTDAAAHAAAIELRNAGNQADATSRALALKQNNRVDGQSLALMEDTNITPGNWNYATRTFVPGPWATASAVRARARYQANWTLARVFGVTNRLLMQESVAALGSVSSSSCLKPWAVPYSNLLVTLGRQPTDTAYRLSAADVNTLRNNQTPIKFKISSGNTDNGGGTVGGTIISGNYYAVKYGPVQFADGRAGNPVSGGNVYRNNIADPGCSATGSASVGDWLDMENGNMIGPTGQGMRGFCGVNGNGNNGFSCSEEIVMPIWSQRTTGNGSAWVRILYIASFRLTGYDRDDNVLGYLTALSAGTNGGFQPVPGPVSAAALVQ